MIINGEQTKTKNFIKYANVNNFRSASYDLTIGDIMTSDGKLVTEFEIPPQGIVKIISAEEVTVPQDLMGYVHVKTSLCNEGILPLNIGLVDPGFSGPLQSTLVNFGKAKILLKTGTVFSRLVFHKIESSQNANAVVLDRAKVRESVRKDTLAFMADSFMDIQKTSLKAAEQAFGNYKDVIFRWMPLSAIGITILTFALNYMNIWATNRTFRPEDAARTELLKGQMDDSINALKEQNKKLQIEVDLLREVLSKKSENTAATKNQR